MSPTDAELAFVDQVGRHYQRHYAVPPMLGRVVGWLLICDPPAQTAAEIAESLQASRSAIGTALNMIETWGSLRRMRSPGERADRVRLVPISSQALESPAEYGALAALANHGLDVLHDAPSWRKARLLEMGAFAEFLLERLPALGAEWQERRDALRASGELPDWSPNE
jgi:DNA-binding MarR family transcriptional regulator